MFYFTLIIVYYNSNFANKVIDTIKDQNLFVKRLQRIIVSPKIGYTMDHAPFSSTTADIFLCSTHKPNFFLGFKWLAVARDLATLFLSFVSQGVKIIFWGVKNVCVKNFACVQAIGHSFFQIYFKFGA